MSDNTSQGMGAGSYIIFDEEEPKKEAGPVAPKKAAAPAPSAAVAPPPASPPSVPLATASAPVPGQLSQTSVNVPLIAEQTKEAQEKIGPARAAPPSNMLEDPSFQKGALGGAALLAALGLTVLAISKVVGKKGKTPSTPSGVEPTLEPTPIETAPKTLSESVAQQKAAAANLTAQEQEMIAKSEQAKADKAKIAERKAVKEQIAEVQAKAAAEAPEGMRPNYIKNAKNPIGPGGFNWLYGQEGERAAETWRNLFGEKNVPYDEAMKRYREFELSGQEPGRGLGEVPRHAAGGTNVRPKYIPKYIQGSVAPNTLIPLAGTALTAMAATQAIKHGLKTGDWSPAGELGLNVGAMAINPALGFLTHMSGAGEGEDQELARRRYKAAVGGGRGIAPPSAYPR